MTIFVTRTSVRSEVINAGRQLLMICIHLFSFLSQFVMNINMLSVPSDRGRQTHRSENVQTVTGILFPTASGPDYTVRAPGTSGQTGRTGRFCLSGRAQQEHAFCGQHHGLCRYCGGEKCSASVTGWTNRTADC